MKLIKAKQQTYSEIGQQINIKFSFCTKKDDVLTQLFDWIKCRDFLGDCLHSRDIGENFYIYGFNFDYSQTPLDEDATKLLVKIPEKYIETVRYNLHFLNNINHEVGLENSCLIHVEEDIYYFEGDKFWQKTTQLISFYTLAIKCLAVKHENSLWDSLPEFSNEYVYVEKILPEFPMFLGNLLKIFKEKKYDSSGYENKSFDHLHDHSGIKTFLDKGYDNYKWKLNNDYYKEYLKCQNKSA